MHLLVGLNCIAPPLFKLLFQTLFFLFCVKLLKWKPSFILLLRVEEVDGNVGIEPTLEAAVRGRLQLLRFVRHNCCCDVR